MKMQVSGGGESPERNMARVQPWLLEAGAAPLEHLRQCFSEAKKHVCYYQNVANLNITQLNDILLEMGFDASGTHLEDAFSKATTAN